MGATDCSAVVKLLEQCQLSEDEVALLQSLLANVVQPGQCLPLIEEAAGKRACPYCGGPRCHRCGQANGLQRYRCVVCRRSFNVLTGTPLARLRLRDKWLPYLQCVIESTTIRTAAKRVAVAKSTSFRWRHRFIAAVLQETRPKLSGIVERQEECSLASEHRCVSGEQCSPKPLLRYHLESQKGSRNLKRPPRKRGGNAAQRGISAELDCILVARDRNRQTYAFVTAADR